MVTRFVALAPQSPFDHSFVGKLRQQLDADGHHLELVTLAGVEDALRKRDAFVAWNIESEPSAAVALGIAKSMGRPSLLLSKLPNMESAATRVGYADTIEGLLKLVTRFYGEAQPFAGRLVRDLIPQLVEDGGHKVKFRALREDEKPYFLKLKLLAEAQELMDADIGQEVEEVADVLEALEALLRVRGYERDRLRQVKDAKTKRRGGFERCYVVEETTGEVREPSKTIEV